jgi:hypothetical protein
VSTPNIRELRRQRAARAEGKPWWLRLLITAVVLFTIYVLFGFFAAPSIIRSQIEQRGSAFLKREVKVGEVTFNPLTLSLRVDRLLVNDPNGKPVLGWASLFVNFQLWALVSDEIHFQEIALDGFAGNLHVSKEGILNIADIGSDTRRESPGSGKEWALRIDRLAVNRAEIDYTDESRPEVFKTHVGPSTFVLREFRTSGTAGAPGVFTASTEAGEEIAWTGRLALAPLRSNGELRLTRLQLRKYAPFYPATVNFDVLGGSLDLQLPYEFSIQNNKPQVRVTEAGAKLEGLQIADKGKTEPAVELGSIDVTGLAADLQGRLVELGKIALTGGKITATRTHDGINLAQYAAGKSPAAATQASAPAASSDAEWTLRISEVTTKDLTVGVNDLTAAAPANVELTRTNLTLRRFSSASLAAPVPVELRGEVNPGSGSVRLTGEVALQPLKANLSYTLDGVSLTSFGAWVQTAADVRLKNGIANARGRIEAGENAGNVTIAATADAELGLLEVTDALGAPIFGWKSVNVAGVAYTSHPRRLTVAEVTVADPHIHATRRIDGSLNLTTLARKSATPPAPQVQARISPASDAQFVAIDRIALANGVLRFTDESVEPNVTTSVDRLSGTITGLTSAAIDRADVNIHGRIGGSAPLSITGKMNVLSPEQAFDLRIDARNSDLQPLGAYVGKYVGYALQSGALTVDARAKVANETLDSTANVIVTNFNLGAATHSPDAPKVPVHFALALLKDREGKIALTIPVQGSLADPSFQVGGVISKVIGNLIVKAATSPFSLIGSMFGGGRAGEELSFQDFEPGSSDLDPRDLQKLDVVARALRERPALRLAISGGYEAGADLPALKERELDRRIRTAIWDELRQTQIGLDSPDHVTVTREAASRMLAELYRDVFLRAPEPAPAAPAVEAPAQEEPRKRRFFLFRWFTRDRPRPTPTPTPAPRPTPPPVVQYPGVPHTVIGAEPLPNETEMRNRLLGALPIGDVELRLLARERADRVRRYFVEQGQVQPERLELVTDPNAANAGRRARLELR